MKNKKIKISIVLNSMIVLFTIIATTMMFTGFKFSNGEEPVLETTKLGMFKFFTVDSNLLMGIVSLVFIIYEISLIKKRKKEIPKNVYTLKLMSTTSVALTFIVVFFYLGPISSGGIPSMIRNSNLFFHLLIPFFSIITFTMFEKTEKLRVKDSLWGLVPTLVYGIFYIINILIHMENYKISPIYDWYWFAQNGVWTAVIVLPIIIFVTFIISFMLWKINNKIN